MTQPGDPAGPRRATTSIASGQWQCIDDTIIRAGPRAAELPADSAAVGDERAAARVGDDQALIAEHPDRALHGHRRDLKLVR